MIMSKNIKEAEMTIVFSPLSSLGILRIRLTTAVIDSKRQGVMVGCYVSSVASWRVSSGSESWLLSSTKSESSFGLISGW